MLVVLHPPAGDEVVGADDAVVGEDDAARRHAQVRGVVGYRTANAPYQTTYGRVGGRGSALGRRGRLERKESAESFTFGDGGAAGVGDEAGEAHVDGAAEASVHRHRGGKVGDAFPVVELPADGNHAAPHVLAALFTHKAGVDAWKREELQLQQSL